MCLDVEYVKGTSALSLALESILLWLEGLDVITQTEKDHMVLTMAGTEVGLVTVFNEQ
jgi:hypothetical protein